MDDNPCDTCGEDCMGGIIYGNCQHFRTWCKIHHTNGSYFNSRFTSNDAKCQSGPTLGKSLSKVHSG